MINRYELFKLLRRHRKLAEKRSMDFEKNKVAKSIVYVGAAFMLLYMMGISILLSLIANELRSCTTLEFICGALPFILVFDFLMRFVSQQTPSQIIKPYVLLPLPRRMCIETFLITTMLDMGNLLWMALFIPYCIMSVMYSFGIGTTLLLLVFLWLAIVANSQWYIICRTFINDHMLWWLMPLGVWALMFAPWYLGSSDLFFNIVTWPGLVFETAPLLPVFGIMAVLVMMFFINRHVQYTHVMRELMRSDTFKVKRISSFNFLEKYGTVGQFMQLELKLMLRNKNPRKLFISSVTIVVVMSLLISLTDIYDGSFMTNFWGIYNMVIFGAMMLSRVMANEGNYIDCLLVHKENILSLLRAKYIIYSLMVTVPFLLTLPCVFSGKWSLLMLVSYAFFTAGFQHFLLMQMAVYNKMTVPLNTKFISKSGMDNNWMSVIISTAVFFVPIMFVSILQMLFSDTVAYIVMLIIGFVFIATNSVWLRWIYKRMMKRKYVNLEGFWSSR